MIELVFAFVCFCLGTYFGDAPYRKLISAGLAFYIASLIFGSVLK
jgi:hypothetical protein